MEIGGYIELDHYRLPMLHEEAVKLNSGSNCLAYLIETRNIRKIAMPKFMCDSCNSVLQRYGVEVVYYSVGMDFKPQNPNTDEDTWLYVVNFYGQLTNEYLKELNGIYRHMIVDHAQAYFQPPLEHVDTLYTCRKFFGVADGAILYTDQLLNRELNRDESFERMHFLLGRFERSASEFYGEYVNNNHIFSEEPVKTMSKLTENLLHGIDSEYVKNRRTENFALLHTIFRDRNKLKLRVPEGAFMYPLYLENGAEIRKALQKNRIFIPTLWPAVFNLCRTDEPEYDMAENILPLPVDQRYGETEIRYMAEMTEGLMNGGNLNDR